MTLSLRDRLLYVLWTRSRTAYRLRAWWRDRRQGGRL